MSIKSSGKTGKGFDNLNATKKTKSGSKTTTKKKQSK